MIVSKIARMNSALVMPCMLGTHSSLMNSKLSAFWYGNDRRSKKDQKVFKKQSFTDKADKASKPEAMSIPATENSSRRLFKRPSDQAINISPSPQHQPPSTQPTTQLSQQSTRKLSIYTFHTCQLLLNTFKDQAKQSKYVDVLLHLFDNYQHRLVNNSVETTELKDSYKTIMYAAAMRALSRILRREAYVDRVKLMRFLGKDYHAIAELELSVLTTLEVSDIVAFFFMFEAAYKFRTFSQATVAVVDKYLQQLYNRYTSESLSKLPPTTREPIYNTERQDKRFVNQLITVAKTAQLFHSPFYDGFLDLLLQNLTQHKLVPNQITAFAKFLLKPQNLTSVNKELQLLQILMNKMQSTEIIHEFDYITLRELYANLMAIVDNNSLLMDMTIAAKTLDKIEQYVLGVLPQMNSEQICLFALFSFKRYGLNNQQLGSYILQHAFSQITQNGQTSLNPIFIISLLSTNVDQNVKYTQIDPLWEDKFVNMYNRYMLGDKTYPNLASHTTELLKIVHYIASKRVKQAIMQSFISTTASCIIPYESDSLMLENYYLQQQDKMKMLAAIYRLQEMRTLDQKAKGLFRDVFQTLQKSLISVALQRQLDQSEKTFIKSAQPLKQNRQMYIKTLSRYCHALDHQQLIYSIFHQSLISIVDHSKYFSHSPTNPQTLNFPESVDQKCRDKCNALFHNFIGIAFEIDLKLMRKDGMKIEEKLAGNKFFMLIKEHDMFVGMFVEVLALRDVATAVHYYDRQDVVDFLLAVLRFLLAEGRHEQVQEQRYNKTQKYYFVYYQILKNYPVQKLHKILLSPQSKPAIDKILNAKKSPNHKKTSPLPDQTIASSRRAHLVYDTPTGQLYMSEEQVKILRKKVEKCLEMKTAQGQSNKSA